MSRLLIEFKNVSKTFKSTPNRSIKSFLLNQKVKEIEFCVLKNINLKIYDSTSLGVVGANGAGKSTLLLMINDIIKPDEGEIILHEKPSGFLELGSGFNPELSGEENVFLYGALLGLSQKKIKDSFDKILKFSELKNHISKPLKVFSQGMLARLAFSTLIQSASKLILIDEVLSVGDFKFQKKCKNFFNDYVKSGGSTVLVHHTASVVEQFCNEGIYLKNKKIFFKGTIGKALDRYMNRKTDSWYKSSNKTILSYPSGYSINAGLDRTDEILNGRIFNFK